MKRQSKPPFAEAGRDQADYRTGSNGADEGVRSLERALGAKIRVIRREKDLSVLDLSNASNISAGMLSKIENGQISPSLSTLQSIASALNVPLSLLFAASEERRGCSFARGQQGVVVERPGAHGAHVLELLPPVIRGVLLIPTRIIT